MKVQSYQLEQHLTKSLHKVYMICGEEPFLVQEVLENIRQKAKTAGFIDRIQQDIDTDADLAICHSHAYTPPLFSGRRLLELQWKGKLTKNSHAFMQNYANNPSPHTLLIMRFNKLDSRTEQTKWFQALEKLSVVIPIWPLPQKQLPTWIVQRAKTLNLQITPDAALALAHAVQGNLNAAAQEIEKLSLCGAPIIDRPTVDELVSDQGCFNAFDLVDYALAGNASQTRRILHYLQYEGSEPLMILGACTHELRNIAKMAKDLKKGSNLTAIFAQYRVRISRQNSTREFLRRCSYEDCLNLLVKAGEIDRIVKGAKPGKVWEALEDLGLGIALTCHSRAGRNPYLLGI